VRHLLNTLFIASEGAALFKEGETVEVKVGDETKAKIPIHTLGGIVVFGNIYCSPPLLGLCAENHVAVSFLSAYGRFIAKVVGPVSGNVHLRREQYRRADDPVGSAEIARTLVIGKIANCRTVLQRALRDHPEILHAAEIQSAIDKKANILQSLATGGKLLDFVRGKEGEAGNYYFGVFDHLVTAQKDDFTFQTRNRRPPLDRVNSLLSFFYTLLVHDVESALETVGLDPAVGFLHRDRPGRPGLALDLMEELRPFLADRLALSLINRNQLHGKDFKITETGAVILDPDARKLVLTAYQTRKQEEIMHPYLGEKINVGLLPFVQAMLLARHLRGDIDGYPPFIWK
jgi:CRISPR-associated protein Cas1